MITGIFATNWNISSLLFSFYKLDFFDFLFDVIEKLFNSAAQMRDYYVEGFTSTICVNNVFNPCIHLIKDLIQVFVMFLVHFFASLYSELYVSALSFSLFLFFIYTY